MNELSLKLKVINMFVKVFENTSDFKKTYTVISE